METLLTIWEKIQQNKKEDPTHEFTWKPIKCEDYTLPEFIIPDTRKKECQKALLSKVLAFIDLNKQRRFAEGCTIMPIPTTSKRLIAICGSSMEVSRLIKFMISIGLISVESDTYSYNNNKTYSKTYRYYYDNELKILEYCNNNNVNIYEACNIHTLVNTFTIDKNITSFDDSQVRFSSKLHLLRPDDYSKAKFENYLSVCLYDNYPQLEHYQKLADDINRTYYKNYPDFRIRFVPSFTWNSTETAVVKIGIRATNALVGAKKVKNNTVKEDNRLYRDDIIKKYKFNLRKDVSSSVPRITISLNNGYWLPESTDIYRIIYEVFKELNEEEVDIRDTLVNTFAEDDFLTARAAIKGLHMSGYFDDNLISVHTYYRMHHDGEYNEVDKIMRKYKEAVLIAEGGQTYGSEIFYHESCIYLEVLKRLLDEGFFVWEVYDEWFARKAGWTQEDYEKYVTEILEEIANEYIFNLREKPENDIWD